MGVGHVSDCILVRRSSLAKWLDDPPIDLDIRDLKGNELLVSAPVYADDVGTAADGTTGQSESRLARRLAVLKERGAEPPTVCGLFNKSDRVLAVGEGAVGPHLLFGGGLF